MLIHQYFLCFLDIFSLLFCVRVTEYGHQIKATELNVLALNQAGCSLRFGVFNFQHPASEAANKFEKIKFFKLGILISESH